MLEAFFVNEASTILFSYFFTDKTDRLKYHSEDQPAGAHALTARPTIHNHYLPLIALFLIALNLCSCQAAFAGPFRIASARDYKVYFATTRLNESRSNTYPVYNGKRHIDLGHGSIEYGFAKLKRPALLQNVEDSRSFAEFKARLKINDQAWSTTAVSDITGMDKQSFQNTIRNWRGIICIFVHGYDENFNDSLRDTAIVGSELDKKSNEVLPVLFSWPSLDKTTEYAADEANLDWSKAPFRQFIEEIARIKNPSAKLYLVAHSLGSRLAFDLTDSASLYADRAIDKLVLSSSDMDYHMALQKKDLLESITRDMVYVMVSDRDGPLITSQLLHGSPRLGRPFDPPNISTQNRTTTAPKQSFWKGLLQEAVDMLAPDSTDENTPEVGEWLKNGYTKESEFGNRSRLYDVTELVTADLGHRIAWPVITSLLAEGDSLYPLGTRVVFKKPDRLILEQSNGKPSILFRFHRVTMDRFGIK